MNSQQELLDAIKAISDNGDRSYDTPATVLRVDGDTVWVHIDGGADETPVSKTINCEQGETVQVRIANGSAFLVGNASAPPTDDKTANVAHFVAEQADIKAVKAEATAIQVSETVEELEVEVDGKVDVGTSNIQHLSSTMYQDAYGVNIFNDTLAVGDSYAHIDGDSFDIKEATTAGTIDNTNDTIVASFGENSYMQSKDAVITGTYYKLSMASDSIKLATIESNPSRETGWKIDGDKIERYGDIYSGILASIDASGSVGSIGISSAHLAMEGGGAYMNTDGQARFYYSDGYGNVSGYTDIDQHTITAEDEANSLYYYDNETGEEPIVDNKTVISGGSITVAGDIFDAFGNRKAPVIMTSATISASATSYTFYGDAITSDSCFDIYDSIWGFSPTGITVNSAGSCTVTFPAQSSTHKIKLFVY